MSTIINKANKKQIRFSALEFFFWAACASYTPYLVVYLESLGFSNTLIGMIVSINSVVVVFAQPFWGLVSDRMQSVKRIFILCITAAAAILLTVPLYHKFVIISMVFAGITFFESALMPLLDSWVVQGIKGEEGITYGIVRVWGSVGFALTAFITGKTIESNNVGSIFVIYALIAIFVVIICMFNKDEKHYVKIKIKEMKIGRLIKNYYYVSFLVFATVVCIPHRASTIFMPNLMESVGGTKSQLGLAFSISAVSEIPVFTLSRYFVKKIKPLYLILISMVFFVMRQLLYIIVSSPGQVILVQLLQGVSFALFLTGTVYYVDQLAPRELKATAQTVASSVYFGASAVIGSYLGGWLIDNMGLEKMYEIWTVIDALVSVAFIISLYIGRKIINRK